MPQNRTNSRELREVAESFVNSLPDEIGRPTTDPADLITSLVRQWATYDGKATFFPDEHRQVYADLIRSPLGKVKVGILPTSTAGWFVWLQRDWKIGCDELAEVVDQLNRAQSAEVVNADGKRLRIFVNPKDRSHGVDPVNWDEFPDSWTSDDRRVAASAIEGHLADERLSPDQIGRLAEGVARQWREYDGHACVFVDEHRVLVLKLTKRPDGLRQIDDAWVRADFRHTLAPFGVRPTDVSDVLGRINRGEDVEVRDQNGVRSYLRHDPKARRFRVEPVDPAANADLPADPALFCARCSAVLAIWAPGQREQVCRHCGHVTSRS